MTNGPTFWATGPWWRRCWAVCGTTATPCASTARRCSIYRVEKERLWAAPEIGHEPRETRARGGASLADAGSVRQPGRRSLRSHHDRSGWVQVWVSPCDELGQTSAVDPSLTGCG